MLTLCQTALVEDSRAQRQGTIERLKDAFSGNGARIWLEASAARMLLLSGSMYDNWRAPVRKRLTCAPLIGDRVASTKADGQPAARSSAMPCTAQPAYQLRAERN